MLVTRVTAMQQAGNVLCFMKRTVARLLPILLIGLGVSDLAQGQNHPTTSHEPALHSSAGIGHERIHSTAHHATNMLYVVSGVNMSFASSHDDAHPGADPALMLLWDHALGEHLGIEAMFEHATGDHAGDALGVMITYHLGKHGMLGTGPAYGTNGAAWNSEVGLDWTWMDWHLGPTMEVHLEPGQPSMIYTGIHLGHAIGNR